MASTDTADEMDNCLLMVARVSAHPRRLLAGSDEICIAMQHFKSKRIAAPFAPQQVRLDGP
ncbi:hypothetical protein U4960_13490 [Altererythrobacter sp. H2]|uniref:hypothetical protein n=1 Tax=Altererythrobacter sp. H2 TaxID=3108391 RepID=UPI002B4BB738|nr:hypothetical protein [Altererythrobacter sp. H2]WRK95294.1 hypothetical protein U4960_13490 [Altererythrobacter sp. H2]